MTPAKALRLAIDGETYEYTEMYPRLRKTEREGKAAAQLKITLDKAQKRFAALAKVEERHANHYQAQLASITA
jgi:rubrerythrin